MNSEIRTLTGLRGVAAVWVALYHIHWMAVAAGTIPTPLHHGYLAVDIFFVLSGYVMTMTYTRPRHASWSFGKYLDFLLRRVGRIWPAYVLVSAALLIGMYAHLLKGPAPSPTNTLINFTLTQNWWRVGSIDQPAWSVSAELAVYVVFPILAVAVARASMVTRVISLTSLMCCALLLPTLEAYLTGHKMSGSGIFDICSNETSTPILRCFAEFFMGMFLFRLATPRIMGFAKSPYASSGIFLVFGGLLFFPHSDYIAIAFIPALILVIASSGPITRALFDNPIVYTLGCWSYSLYLVHFHSNAIQIFAEKHLTGLHGAALPASYVLQYGLVILASGLLYKFVEKPAQRRFQALARILEESFHSERLQQEIAKGAV